ncbi:hypothetical protein [Blastococcus sp. SYSU D00695]
MSVAEREDTPATDLPGVGDAVDGRRGDALRRGSAAAVGYLGLQALILVFVARVAPRFFYVDDSLAQFLPMTWWLGRTAQGGRPPILDPEQGMAGNVLADMQYGALDPLHWLIQALAATSDDFLVVSFGFGAATVTWMGLGALAALLTHRVPAPLAVAGAVGISSSGFFLWYGSSWWPLLWSIAWLPWFWFGLSSRGALGILAIGVSSWALLTSGNPYALFFVVVLVLARLLERRRAIGTWRRVLDRPLVLRLIAAVGGSLIAVPTLLSTLQLSSVMGRPEGDAFIGNAGFAVANLADVLLGGPTLMAQTNAWSGNIGLVPAMATMLVALPMLAMVDWRRALRVPGVLAAGLTYLAAVVATQLPTVVVVFRYPLRYVVVAEVFLPALALIAFAAAARVTRGRLRVAGGIVLAQFLLAVFRAPVFWKWHLLATVLAAAGLAAVVLWHRRVDLRRVAGVAVAVVVALAPLVSLQLMVSVQDRVDAIDATDSGGQPFRALYNGYGIGTDTAAYADRSVRVDATATVITWRFEPDWGWGDGVMVGNANLAAGFRPGFGSLAVWHAEVNRHWCRSYQGATCSDPADLLAEAGDTGVPWIDLLSSDTVLLNDNAPTEIRQHFDGTWDRGTTTGPWTEYRREDDLPGRITAADGVTVSPSGWRADLARVGKPMDVYVVSTGDDPGRLALRIPYYPGMQATLDGRPVSVGSVEGASLAVELPAGVEDGRLEITYAPAGAGLVVPATALGLVVMGVASVVGAVTRRRDAEDA